VLRARAATLDRNADRNAMAGKSNGARCKRAEADALYRVAQELYTGYAVPQRPPAPGTPDHPAATRSALCSVPGMPSPVGCVGNGEHLDRSCAAHEVPGVVLASLCAGAYGFQRVNKRVWRFLKRS